MIENIFKYQLTTQLNYKFCILIPTWNNIKYLKNCINSIKKNSHYNLQIIVIVNEGNDGTLDWLKEQKEIDYIYSKNNIGICYALNIARSLIKSEHIVYVNDDMYMLPDWDLKIEKEIAEIGTKNFMLSCTMIEPIETANSCVIVRDYGRDLNSFNEELLLKEYENLFIDDWSGSTWPPNIVHIDLWDLVGGMSVEFTPGMYSDPDLSKKLLDAGVKIFKGKGNSLVYHFGSKSTKRVRRNNGRKQFIQKWGITANSFTKEFLKIGEKYTNPVENQNQKFSVRFINKIKRIKSCL